MLMTGKESCEDDLSTHTGSSYDSDDDDLAFATLDLKGVDFDDTPSSKTVVDEDDMSWIQLERQVLLYDAHQIPVQNDPSKFLEDKESGLSELVECLNTGRYIDALRGKSASFLFSKSDPKTSTLDPGNISTAIRQKLVAFCTTLERCLEAQMIGVSALNLFLQLNYTGPTLEKNLDSTAEMTTKESILANINPHPLFESYLILSPEPTSSEETKTNHDTDSSSDEKGDGTSKSDEPTFTKAMNKYQNTVLSHLSVDGEWPCQVCETPYFLLLSRIILSTLADPLRKDWTHSVDATESPTTNNENNTTDPILVKREKSDFNSVDMPDSFLANTSKLTLAHLWSARATVAHQRLLQCDEPSLTLWKEAEEMFQKCIDSFCFPMKELNTNKENPKIKGEDEISRYHSHQGMAARIMLEWGLAQHHFDRDGKGKKSFQQAREYSGVKIEVMGAKGKRTKFQTEHKAQMLVRAFSTAPVLDSGENNEKHEEKSSDEVKRDMIKAKEIQHDEEEILLDRVHFEDDQYNVTRGKLQDLDQAILLALCLDVKNDNPIDGLTGEQMGGYLERVLIEHDDWMIYSTGLLERAWLECERTHARERAILQIQALVDQHTNRLTITQSTFKSVEDSAPVQDRLKNLHAIVYPPRWEVMRDLAERYAKLGIVTTAAEMFEELELWDDVVQCYTIAGKASKAEEVVRHRLKIAETPRMWVALGDLTDDISCYEKALELSKGKYATAFIELGKYYFKTGDLQKAFELLQKGLNVKPLTPHIWFLLGTVCMRIDDWDNALHAFCEVVQQEPEEGDAWANIAAVYMHVKDPAKAYPAIIESLKQNRNNWRVWMSKLYTCIDLNKIDEAIQACFQLIEFRSTKNASEQIPELEEKCIRAMIGKSVANYQKATDDKDKAGMDSGRRTLDRVDGLLSKISTVSESKAWIWEVRAAFDEMVGRSVKVLEHSMKEYRSILAVSGWETNPDDVTKMCNLVLKISEILKAEGSRPNLMKCKMMINSVVKKIRSAYINESEIPELVAEIETRLREIESLLKQNK